MGFGNGDDDAQGVNETQRMRRRQYRGLSPSAFGSGRDDDGGG